MAKQTSTPKPTGSKPDGSVRINNSSNPSGKTGNKVTFEGPTLPPNAGKTENKK